VDARGVLLGNDDDMSIGGGGGKVRESGSWMIQGSVCALRVPRKVEIHVLADAVAEVVANVSYLI
jgi:hypothetical protein